MSNYTPGPWFACCLETGKYGCHCGYIFDEGDKTIAQVLHNDPSLEQYEHLKGDVLLCEKEANARLIAAAPDLMEASKEAINVLLDYVETLEKQGGSMNYGRKVIAQLVAAIAKALGTVPSA